MATPAPDAHAQWLVRETGGVSRYNGKFGRAPDRASDVPPGRGREVPPANDERARTPNDETHLQRSISGLTTRVKPCKRCSKSRIQSRLVRKVPDGPVSSAGDGIQTGSCGGRPCLGGVQNHKRECRSGVGARVVRYEVNVECEGATSESQLIPLGERAHGQLAISTPRRCPRPLRMSMSGPVP
jgi:hypothetical protein